METRFLAFVWRYSKREQLYILALTLLSFPVVYASLEIPKIIVNDAISGTEFPRTVLGFELGQIPYLLMLCFIYLALILVINGIKWVMNVTIGMCGERMLRRLRYMLYEHVMRFRMRRFRSTKPGEVIQSMLGEIEPLGGFIGEVIATPAFQGGLLLVYSVFIFVQDVWLGLAAVSLYPIQAFLIPKLQAKVIRLNRERAKNTRGLADSIAESVGNISEIHTNDTARWHLARISRRLHDNTMIRLELFKRKFLIKFINNLLNHLTPFFFFSVGGYLVIQGELDFGSLVAVLAAYKDLAAPWKALLNYIQRWADFSGRFTYVIEGFIGEDVYGPERVHTYPAKPLEGPMVFDGVEGGPGSGGLVVDSLEVSPGQRVAVVGGASGGRETLVRMMAGLAEPAAGRVSVGGQTLADATLAEVGETVGFVDAEPGLISGTLRENLLYGLYRAPPPANAGEIAREAKATGNSNADPAGDWVAYDVCGAPDHEALEARLKDLAELAGLGPDLSAVALNTRLAPDQAQRWTDAILQARARFEADRESLADLMEPWAPESFNTNGTLLANLLFALPAGETAGLEAVEKTGVIEEIGATALLEEVGLDIARAFAELVETVEEGSPLLDGIGGYGKAEIQAAAEIAEDAKGRQAEALPKASREALRAFAAKFIQTRDKLDVLDSTRLERLLAFRAKARKQLAGREDFISFDARGFSLSQTVAQNILHAPRRFDRKSAWKRIDDRLESAIEAEGLRGELIGIALDQDSAAAGLTAQARRRVALARALIKRPRFLILEGVAGTSSDADRKLREAIHADQPEMSIVYAATDDGAAAAADLVARIDETGVLRVEAGSDDREAAEQ